MKLMSRKTNQPLRVPEEIIAAMHAEHLVGRTLAEVGRRFPGRAGARAGKSVRELFVRRGLAVRESDRLRGREIGPDGRLLPGPVPSRAEIRRRIKSLRRLKLPPGCRPWWNRAGAAARRWLLGELRRAFPARCARPETAFSANVEPFDYLSPRAWGIARRLNQGRPSRKIPVRLKLASFGVIWDGRLWLWTWDKSGVGYHYESGKPVLEREPLHQAIYRREHGEIPDGALVFFKDGNHNNLDPANLGVRSRAECAVANSVQARLKADPRNPELRALEERRIAAMIQARRRRSRAAVGVLLERFNAGEGAGLTGELKARGRAARGQRRTERTNHD